MNASVDEQSEGTPAEKSQFSPKIATVTSVTVTNMEPYPMAVTETRTEPYDEEITNTPPEDVECRSCLQRFDYEAGLIDMFQAWEPPWNGMSVTIAEDLAQIANIEITQEDSYSKLICQFCHQKLLDACSFVVNVRINDRLLRQRAEMLTEQEDSWPKPIQIDRNVNSDVYNTAMDVEIKQEVLSDDETYTNRPEETFKEGADATDETENVFNDLEIKIEPEEIIRPPPYQITVNGTITDDQYEQNSIHINGNHQPLVEGIQSEVKEEPPSEEEVEPPPDLPLECMLCTKSFNSVTGLKAHVIAQHSYKTVKRKLEDGDCPDSKRSNKHVCVTCRRSFTTRTDLMVHETCHNKHSCYGCDHKCDTFQQLIRHRRHCKALKNNAPRHKTLDDVKRPQSNNDSLLVESFSRPVDPLEGETKDSTVNNRRHSFSDINDDIKVERLHTSDDEGES